LLAQPAALTCSVSRIAFASGIVGILQARGRFLGIGAAVGSWQLANGFLAFSSWPLAKTKTSPQMNTDVTDVGTDFSKQ
jgi:hypothetical protein